MKAIRGATTVFSDCAEEIRTKTQELLEKICASNGITKENVICIMFSNTSDIRSFYPAKAARECGFSGCALFSSLEPEIDGALPLCIRVMLLAEGEFKVQPVYLHGAANLRKDITKKFNIAIDGPAGSGKSTVAKIISEKLHILYLDTGAMYRACALKCKICGVNPSETEKVAELISSTEISVKYENGAQRTFLDGKDVSEDIRTPEISMGASTVSAVPAVRAKMAEAQRNIAKNTSCVLDGRDIGTNVLPDAEYKFFLTAKPEIRAKRRADENAAKGYVQPFEVILAEIIKRDEQDRTRKVAPLIKAADAIEIDSSEKTAAEVAQFIMNKIQEKI